MKKISKIAFLAAFAGSVVLALACTTKPDSSQQESGKTATEEASTSSAETDVPDLPAATTEEGTPAGAVALMKAYPTQVKGYKDNYIIMADGSKLLYDDGKKKDFITAMDNADIEDMFSIPYDTNCWLPGYQQDPGRIRNDALFMKMYGNTASAVSKHLVKVDWFGQSVRFTSVNGAADQLRAVAAEIAKNPPLKAYVKSSGSFYWRKVRHANRQSAHSYGMTIDIAVSKSDYWAWHVKSADETVKNVPYRNKFPKELVKIFEKHGFIWGGRWYHYDTMHFEYRPELLAYMK